MWTILPLFELITSEMPMFVESVIGCKKRKENTIIRLNEIEKVEK